MVLEISKYFALLTALFSPQAQKNSALRIIISSWLLPPQKVKKKKKKDEVQFELILNSSSIQKQLQFELITSDRCLFIFKIISLLPVPSLQRYSRGE